MAQYNYDARNSAGARIQGILDAIDEKSASDALARNKLFPISIRLKIEGESSSALTFLKRKPRQKDLANMARQFSVMFSVGMPVDQIFSILVKQTEHIGLRDALSSIQNNVGAGLSLSQGFGQHPKYFSKLFISMVEAGELGGILGKTLNELAVILDKEHWLKSKIRSATMYPKIAVTAIIGVTIIALIFVIPPLEGMYQQLGASLPLPTKIIMALSKFMIGYWYIIILLLLGLVYGWRLFVKDARGRRWLDAVLLRTPLFGALQILTENARFCHLTTSLYRSGLPLAYAMAICEKTVSNICFAEEISAIKEKIKQGVSLSRAMQNSKYFTPMVREMCVVGEQTGKIDSVLETTGVFYDDEIENYISNLTTLIEPILIVALFGVVLLLALAVYLPIWDLSSAMLHPK